MSLNMTKYHINLMPKKPSNFDEEPWISGELGCHLSAAFFKAFP